MGKDKSKNKDSIWDINIKAIGPDGKPEKPSGLGKFLGDVMKEMFDYSRNK